MLELIETFDATFGDAFCNSLVAFLKEEFCMELRGVSDIQLDAICVHVTEVAHNCGINTAAPIAQLACLAIATQGTILKDAEVLEYLSDGGLPPEERVQLLVDQLSPSE